MNDTSSPDTVERDYNRMGDLLEKIVMSPRLKPRLVGNAVGEVRKGIKKSYGQGTPAKKWLANFWERTLEYHTWDNDKQEATVAGIKEHLSEGDGDLLDLINQIFIAKFIDYRELVKANFHLIFNEDMPEFLKSKPRDLRDDLIRFHNFSYMFNNGRRVLGESYAPGQREDANKQFGNVLKYSSIFVKSIDSLLAERNDLEVEYRRFSQDSSYERYKESMRLIEESRERANKLAVNGDIALRNAKYYILFLADHYASKINHTFIQNLKPEGIARKGISIDEIERATNMLSSRYIQSISALPRELKGWLPTISRDTLEFYRPRNMRAYFEKLRDATRRPI